MSINNSSSEIFGHIKRDTGKAILVELRDFQHDDSDRNREEWFPLSTVEEIHHASDGNEWARIIVNDWILREKGLI